MGKKAPEREIARDCLAMRARRLDRVVTRLYDEALRPHGLKSTQLSLLTAIALEGEAQPAHLARALEMEKSTVSRNVGRLLEQGWVAVREGEDGRTQLLSLTATGRKLLREAHGSWKQAQKKAKKVLGAATSDALSRIE